MILCQGGWMPTNLSEGWRQLGCSVEEFFYGTHMGKCWNAEGRRLNCQVNADLLATANQLKAEGHLDLIFAVIYDDVLEVETAQQLRALNVPMINYHVDLVGQWYRVLRTGRYFDRVACAQVDNWSGLKRAGIRPYYMPMAANPPIATAQSLSTNNSDKVLYLGSPWHYRRQVLAELARREISLHIYGHNWQRRTSDPANAQSFLKNVHDLRYYLLPRLKQEGWAGLKETIKQRFHLNLLTEHNVDIPSECIKGSYSDKNFSALVKEAAINLGFTHFSGNPGTSTEKRQVRLREFEIPINGGFYLTQDCPQLRELFCLGKTVAAWDSLSDLYDKVQYYLNHPAERQEIAQLAQAHCLQHHTWKKRFSNLLKELSISISA
jgi:hypothetical protein